MWKFKKIKSKRKSGKLKNKSKGKFEIIFFKKRRKMGSGNSF